MQKKSLTILGALACASTLLAHPGHGHHGHSHDHSSSKAVGSDSAFNPAMSVVIGGRFYYDTEDGEGYDILEHAAGAGDHHHGDGHHHHHGPEQGFSLDEIELNFAAAVDNYFDAELTLAFEGRGVEIEEAFMQTRSLPSGLTLKAGRFLSDIGYQNSQHAHDWAFADQNLPYLLLLGDHGLVDTGVQLSWVPATDTYMRFGFEAFQGEHETLAAYEPGYDKTHDGNISNTSPDHVDGFKHSGGPRLFTLYGQFAPDLGWDDAMQFGFSIVESSLHQEAVRHGSGYNLKEGTNRLYGLDWVYKRSTGGSFGAGDLTLQAEYLYREKDLEVVGYTGDRASRLGRKYSSTVDGLYLQGTYGIAPRWQAGLRYEALGLLENKERWSNDASAEKHSTSSRITAAATFYPTEFSLLRAQVSQNSIHEDDHGDHHKESFTQFTLQYQVMLGAHAAHKF